MRESAVMNRPRWVLLVLVLLALGSATLFLTLGARGGWGFVLAFRGGRLLALATVAFAVAVSTILFQTVTENRILTPSVMGFDALFVLVQTALVFALGQGALVSLGPIPRFAVNVAVMTGFSLLLFRWLFLRETHSLHRLVLVGIVLGILFRSLSNFLQRILDPNAFQVLQDTLFASFSRADVGLLGVSLVLIAAASLVLLRIGHRFDVLTLGRSHAISLGLDHHRTVMTILLCVSVLVAVSTALVGPVTFFGLLVASLARALVGDSRHRFVLPAAVLLAIVTLVGGQTILERVFRFDTALSIIVEFLGGLVFLVLVLRGAAR
ncbi:iron chelate uptake ABC transporter family permease subunit [Aureimonas sp. AU40]|uniref:iron chelate uptake ABC transporter family permease subunit n=1 Tax=Aureimonas sp. AU40 TaxID=1637747 RepID=UPI00078240A4|nr:iron chelate uptake ABC transporter family permease subunit [Aureimonas sp. AU40]